MPDETSSEVKRLATELRGRTLLAHQPSEMAGIFSHSALAVAESERRKHLKELCVQIQSTYGSPGILSALILMTECVEDSCDGKLLAGIAEMIMFFETISEF